MWNLKIELCKIQDCAISVSKLVRAHCHLLKLGQNRHCCLVNT